MIFQTKIDATELSKLESFGSHVKEYIVGSFVLAFLAAALVGLSSYTLISLFSRKKA
jgi:hypothetical protein